MENTGSFSDENLQPRGVAVDVLKLPYTSGLHYTKFLTRELAIATCHSLSPATFACPGLSPLGVG